MRNQHQKTDLGTIMERDWVTTNGLNVLRFGSGRRVWYNSGNFVFTTANIPTYHKKHKLATDVKEWNWDDCKSADGTVNTITPNFNTKDLRDYAYYGSCTELIRETIEDIISDFPGHLLTTFEYPITDWEKTGHKVDYLESKPNFKPNKGDISSKISTVSDYSEKCGYNRTYYYYDGNKWIELIEVRNVNSMVDFDKYYYVSSDDTIKKLSKNNDGESEVINISSTPSSQFKSYYTKDFKYYEYNYENSSFEETDVPRGVVDGFVLENPFNIDMHHRRMNLGKYDNSMRFMSNSWDKYCVVNSEGEEKITSYAIKSNEPNTCVPCNEGLIMHEITITTEKNKYIINAYYVGGKIIYVHKNTSLVEIRPQQEYIDEYFASLKGFKRQLLRQDTKPLYSNKFITPTVGHNLVWYYPEQMYTWPSNGYCIDISSSAFENFVNDLFDIGQNFDEIWSDNLYRSMTHESIKNFDWTYSREYYEGDAQDNIDGGERMQKIIRVYGRVFDDIKLYIDTIKQTKNVTYDTYRNAPEALLSDENNIKGIDVKSTISSDYDLDASISVESLNQNVKSKDKCWANGGVSKLPKWYPTRKNEDVYTDICDNEIMRRLFLSAKRIMQTKGTQHGIEMMMGLFGFGKDIDYEIEEEAYYTEKMIPSEECVDGSIDGNTSHQGKDWSKTTGVDWKKVNSHKKGELATEINSDKDLDLLYYEDPLTGTAMREVLLGRENTSYIVPYYDSTQLYDGNLIFQGKGGWGKFLKRGDTDLIDNCFDYQETLSYLHIVGTVGELLAVNPYTVDNNTIYYVASLEDYTRYDENPPMNIKDDITMSHYFILINNFETHKLSSWKNVVVKTELDIEGKLQKVTDKEKFQKIFGSGSTQDWAYSPDVLSDTATDEDKLGTYIYAFERMVYLDNIFSTNVGNNPHVGYGKYDDGETFIEYMKLPFKYLIDNQNISNSSLALLAKQYKFDDISNNKVYDKIQIMNSRQKNDKELTDFVKYTTENKGEELVTEYKLGDDKHNIEKRWFINSKVLTITNKINSPSSYKVVKPIMNGEEILYPQGRVLDNEEYDALNTDDQKKCIIHYLFDDYFKNIIMPYLMQVIPSTTILKLKDFSI